MIGDAPPSDMIDEPAESRRTVGAGFSTTVFWSRRS
jgi:hypothetical protein